MLNESIHNNKKVYKVAKLSEKGSNPFNLLNLIEEAVVNSYPWDNTYTPKTAAKIFYTESRICISFKAWEEKITATYLNINDPVYKDSCVEFFFNPNPKTDKRYFNLEMNPFGAFLLGIGEGRQNRTLIDDVTPEVFQITTSVTPQTLENYNGKYWTVQYSIPFAFIEKYYGKIDFISGHVMKANLYKCGDLSHYEHYGSWNPITLDKPDFHCPEFFGDFIFK